MHTYNVPYHDCRSRPCLGCSDRRKKNHAAVTTPRGQIIWRRWTYDEVRKCMCVCLYTCIPAYLHYAYLHTYRCVLCICTICTSKSDRRLILSTLEPQRQISTTTTTTTYTSVTAAALHTTSTSTVLLSSPPKPNRTDTVRRG